MADSLAEPIAGVVLAAGAGTRLRPLTDLCPKPLCPIGDSTLLDRAIVQVASAVGPVAVNVHHCAEAMLAHLAHLAHLADRGDLHVSLEEPEALGTAGALAFMAAWLDGRSALVANADTVHGEDLGAFVAGWDGECVRVLMTGEEPFGPRSGVVASIAPWSDIVELRAEPSGLWEVLWHPAIEEGRLEWVHAAGAVIDCGTVSAYVLANRYLAEGRIATAAV